MQRVPGGPPPARLPPRGAPAPAAAAAAAAGLPGLRGRGWPRGAEEPRGESPAAGLPPSPRAEEGKRRPKARGGQELHRKSLGPSVGLGQQRALRQPDKGAPREEQRKTAPRSLPAAPDKRPPPLASGLFRREAQAPFGRRKAAEAREARPSKRRPGRRAGVSHPAAGPSLPAGPFESEAGGSLGSVANLVAFTRKRGLFRAFGVILGIGFKGNFES